MVAFRMRTSAETGSAAMARARKSECIVVTLASRAAKAAAVPLFFAAIIPRSLAPGKPPLVPRGRMQLLNLAPEATHATDHVQVEDSPGDGHRHQCGLRGEPYGRRRLARGGGHPAVRADPRLA